jgi:hypothetical protein
MPKIKWNDFMPDRLASLDVQFASDSFDLTAFEGCFVTLDAKPFKSREVVDSSQWQHFFINSEK